MGAQCVQKQADSFQWHMPYRSCAFARLCARRRKKLNARKGASRVGAKEDHHGTRQRYTIMSTVQSWTVDGGAVPRIAVLFKADSGERVLSGLSPPPWLLLQTQERGSYRTEDVVAFLEWTLPRATRAEESIVVLLDWFAAHLSEEVATCIHERGHVLLHHGGGVTGFEQVNVAWLGNMYVHA